MSNVASVVAEVVGLARARGASVLELVCAGMAALCVGSALPVAEASADVLLGACGAPRNDGAGPTSGPERRPVALPSGRVAWVPSRITARHAISAARLLPEPDRVSMYAMTLAMIATCVEVDGREVGLEEAASFPQADVWALFGLVGGRVAA